MSHTQTHTHTHSHRFWPFMSQTQTHRHTLTHTQFATLLRAHNGVIVTYMYFFGRHPGHDRNTAQWTKNWWRQGRHRGHDRNTTHWTRKMTSKHVPAAFVTPSFAPASYLLLWTSSKPRQKNSASNKNDDVRTCPTSPLDDRRLWILAIHVKHTQTHTHTHTLKFVVEYCGKKNRDRTNKCQWKTNASTVEGN